MCRLFSDPDYCFGSVSSEWARFCRRGALSAARPIATAVQSDLGLRKIGVEAVSSTKRKIARQRTEGT